MALVNRERRERIATACLQAIIAIDNDGVSIATEVRMAVKYADALIEALEEEK